MDNDRKRVYIVDDDESVCRALKYLLMTFDFEVETFLSGHDFFKNVTGTDPGCLVLDVHLPGLNGWEIQKKLIESGSKRPVIVITADKNGGLRERALSAGAVGFLQKPFDDQALINLIHQAFNKGGMDMKNNYALLALIFLITLSVAGCNMFKGVGKDMENAGASIQKTADR